MRKQEIDTRVAIWEIMPPATQQDVLAALAADLREYNLVAVEPLQAPHHPAELRCLNPRCRHHFTATPGQIAQRDTGCPQCRNAHMSRRAAQCMADSLDVPQLLLSRFFPLPSAGYRPLWSCSKCGRVYREKRSVVKRGEGCCAPD